MAYCGRTLGAGLVESVGSELGFSEALVGIGSVACAVGDSFGRAMRVRIGACAPGWVRMGAATRVNPGAGTVTMPGICSGAHALSSRNAMQKTRIISARIPVQGWGSDDRIDCGECADFLRIRVVELPCKL